MNAPQPAQFVHLHVHSEYSVADGLVRIKTLADSAARLGFAAVALTDLCNVHALVKFYRACLAEGVKPIVGCDVWVRDAAEHAGAEHAGESRMILLCCNHAGYQNLSKLLTDAYLRARKDKAVLEWDELQQLHGGLLALWDDREGPLAQTAAEAQATIEKYRGVFGDRLYFQISRVGAPGEAAYIRRAAKLAVQHNIGLVATNRVQFIAAEEFDAHEIRVCIHDGRVLQDARRPRNFTAAQYFRSGDEMVKLFADLPQAIANTVEVAKRCNLFLQFGENHLPQYREAADDSESSAGDAPQKTPAMLLRRFAEDGLCKRLGVANLRGGGSTGSDAAGGATGGGDDAGTGGHTDTGDTGVDENYIARLEKELKVIDEMGFSSYFLIVADFIRWSKENGIPVGPGRGSGAGSLVAWATGITELDPLQYGLLFERFLNPERVSLPDFDIDFCVDGRDRVIDYVARRYGREQVAQIITFGTMAARASVRDVGRVMGLQYGFVDQIAKLIPTELGMTLQGALQQEEVLKQRYDDEEEVRELLDNAMQLEGVTRNVSTHAGGVVIAPRPLHEFTPLYADASASQPTTQLDKDDLEAIGLVKFDFLGLRTLTIIDAALKMINAQLRQDNKPPLDIARLPLDDLATYKMIQSGRTKAIFQIESRGIGELIMRLLPDKFDDLVALVALYRPGPLQSGMVDDYVERKHGRKSVVYPHDKLAPILQPTHGVIVYQEQVMQAAQAMAGYTLGESDLLRVAISKKKEGAMDEQRTLFLAGASMNDVKQATATRVFDLMAKFAGYGFNKSHSVAYALLAYHTAWLKAHYPAAFMAAALSSELSDTDKVVELLAECEKMKLKVHPPAVNASGHGFRPLPRRAILYGLGAVKGIGKNASMAIQNEREAHGGYRDLFDMCSRLGRRIANKPVLEALVKSGALDEFDDNRAALMADIDNAVQAAEQRQASHATGQNDLFGEVQAPEAPAGARHTQVQAWSEAERLAAEKQTLGLYLSGHPFSRYRVELADVAWRNVRALDLQSPKSGIFAGLVFSMRIMKTKRGKMAFIVLDNADERVETVLYSEQFKRYRAVLKKDNVLVVYGEFGLDEYNGGVQLRAEAAADLDGFRAKCLRRIHINLSEGDMRDGAPRKIQNILREAKRGPVNISFGYRRDGGSSGVIKLGAGWKVMPSRPVIDALVELLAMDNLKFDYDAAALRNEGKGRGNGQWRRGRG